MKTLLTIITIYLFFRISVRYLFPWLLKVYIKKVQKRYYEQNGSPTDDNQQKTNKNNPKVTINYPGRKKHFDIDNIEYTDYEEIKDKDNNKQHE